jgi:hypothetical protein
MSDLVTRAQIVILAETMDTDPERLRHLERLGADKLRVLREHISNALYDELATTFARISALAPLVPPALVAKVAQAVIPPLVAGRAGGALGVQHQDKVTGVLTHLSARYMADCAPYLDPRTIAVLAPTIPGGLLVPAANELMRRRAYVTASRFVEFATPNLVRELEHGIDDKAGVLHTVALTQSPQRLREIITMLPPDRVTPIIQTAAGSPELMLAGLSLLARLDHDLIDTFGEAFLRALYSTTGHATDPDSPNATPVRTMVEHDAVAELLTVAVSLSPAALDLIATDSAMTEPDTADALVDVANTHDLWPGLDNILERLPNRTAQHSSQPSGISAHLTTQATARATVAASRPRRESV